MTTDSSATTGSNPRDRSKVFLSLQASRGIAALMVVFYHCEGLLSVEKYWHWTRHYFFFGAGGVDFFFVLSGTVILYAHQADVGRPDRLASYAWKRFRRIYPIYWVVLFPLIPVYFLVPWFGDGTQTQLGVIVSSIVLLPLSKTDTIIPVAWTLFHEIMFYMVFAFLLLRRWLGVIALCLWMIASVVALLVPVHSPVLAFYMSPLHLLFGLGLLIPFALRHVKINGELLAACGIVLFVSWCIMEDIMGSAAPYIPLTLGAFSAIAACGLMLAEKAGRLRVPKYLVLLGDASYSLYLIHYLAISVAAKILYPIWLKHPLPMIFPFLMLLFVAVGAGLALHFWVERPLLNRLSPAPRTLNP